ncbi:hypothetical protein B0H19DRAFT_1367075, partial [Mycena capillaripes]
MIPVYKTSYLASFVKLKCPSYALPVFLHEMSWISRSALARHVGMPKNLHPLVLLRPIFSTLFHAWDLGVIDDTTKAGWTSKLRVQLLTARSLSSRPFRPSSKILGVGGVSHRSGAGSEQTPIYTTLVRNCERNLASIHLPGRWSTRRILGRIGYRRIPSPTRIHRRNPLAYDYSLHGGSIHRAPPPPTIDSHSRTWPFIDDAPMYFHTIIIIN